MDETIKIYDNLLRFESKDRKGYPYPIHKKLIQPFGKKNLLEWLISYLQFSKDDYVLDAGCGTGHTLFHLHKKFNIKGAGITVSLNEANYASIYSKKHCLDKYLKFEQGDYKLHKSGPYTKILCIESLKHATDLKESINNLLYNLSPGGKLVIIDDFIRNDSRDIYDQKKMWNSPAFDHVKQYTDIIDQNKSYHIQIIDLSKFVPSRRIWRLNLLIYISVIYKWVSFGINSRNINTYLGGLVLEKQYAMNNVSYLAIIVEHKIIS